MTVQKIEEKSEIETILNKIFKAKYVSGFFYSGIFTLYFDTHDVDLGLSIEIGTQAKGYEEDSSSLLEDDYLLSCFNLGSLVGTQIKSMSIDERNNLEMYVDGAVVTILSSHIPNEAIGVDLSWQIVFKYKNSEIISVWCDEENSLIATINNKLYNFENLTW